MNRPQNSDRFSLDETLAAMERLGRPESYRMGYADGFAGRYSRRLDEYGRGCEAGMLARRRGAHGGQGPLGEAS